MEISILTDRAFKVMIMKMLTDLGRRLEEHSENFNNVIENIFLKSTKQMIIVLKYTLENFNSTVDKIEVWIIELEDKAMENTEYGRKNK